MLNNINLDIFYKKLTKKIKNDLRFKNDNWELHLQKNTISENLTNLNKLKTFKQPSYFTMKPIGLWTSGLYGNSENNIYWTNWLVREMPEWADPKKTNYYMIKIDYNKLYIINNKEDYNNFNKKFISTDGKYIDWKKVQDNNYFGIHISKPFSLFNMSKFDMYINWTYSWDCTSTCIWNKDAILEVIKISIDDLFKNDTKKVISEKLINNFKKNDLIKISKEHDISVKRKDKTLKTKLELFNSLKMRKLI
jgi:hypothetical protein